MEDRRQDARVLGRHKFEFKLGRTGSDPATLLCDGQDLKGLVGLAIHSRAGEETFVELEFAPDSVVSEIEGTLVVVRDEKYLIEHQLFLDMADFILHAVMLANPRAVSDLRQRLTEAGIK